MKQIKEKQFFYKYLHDKNYEDKSIILISISFDSYTHGIKDYMVETVR